jgi:hypothetical protein
VQNKANSTRAKMNLNSILTQDYENKHRLASQGKQTQNKPNLIQPVQATYRFGRMKRFFALTGGSADERIRPDSFFL